MNKALVLARGCWVYFLGSDDYFYDNLVLNTIYDKINENNGLEVFYGNVLSTRFCGKYDGEFSQDKLFKQNICHQAIFFKKSLFLKIGRFNLKYKILADYDNNIKWFLDNKIKKKYCDILIANYSDGGLSSVTSDNLFLNDKNKLFLKYKNNLNKNLKYFIYRDILKNKKKNNEIFDIEYILLNIILFFSLFNSIKNPNKNVYVLGF
jgi:hypothetical protein